MQQRISDKIGLYDVNGQKRPIYTFRHSFISNRRSKEVDPNVVAIHSNTSVAMLIGGYLKSQEKEGLALNQKSLPKCQRTQKSEKITYT